MGVLPAQTIREMIRLGFIEGIDEKFINPASLDMPVSDEAYRLEKTFMPQPGETIRAMLSWAGATPHDLKAPLEVGGDLSREVGRFSQLASEFVRICES